MNLIFIYGPPAAGKLTVANQLGMKIGYKIFNGQTLINCISDLFPFDDKKLEPVLKRLSIKYRLDIYEEAAKNDVNLIVTYDGGSTIKFKYFYDVKRRVEKHGGNVYFVQLLPNEEALLNRVTSDSRKGLKIDSPEYLKEKLDKYPKYLQKLPRIDHITIDNSNMEPNLVVNEIINNYQLKITWSK